MFKFLKDKLKSTISKISKKVEEEGKEEIVEVIEEVKKPEVKVEPKPEVKEEPKPQPKPQPKLKVEEEKEVKVEEKQEPEKKGFFGKLKDKFRKEEPVEEVKPEVKEEPKPEVKPEVKETPKVEEKKEPKVQEKKKPEPKLEPKVKEEKNLPKSKSERETLYKEIAKDIEAEKGAISLSEVLEALIERFGNELDDNRKAILRELEDCAAAYPDEFKLIPERRPHVAVKEAPKPEPKPEPKPKPEVKEEPEEEPEKKGFFGKIREKVVTKKINEAQFEDLFWNLEVALLENNVATEVIEKIKEDLKQELVDKPIRRSKIEKTIEKSLKKSIGELFDVKSFNILEKIGEKKPFVICFVGINGSGKTTTIAKFARLLLDNNKKIVLAAADTFRAAAIDQLQFHADKLGVKLIKHDYGSDPAAVAFDAIKHAESKNMDVVLVDTAGRMHANSNLMEEMSKIVRVAKPDLKIFVGESITGNDCVEQAKKFDEAVGIDAIILSKADVDEKGGAAVSVSYVTKKPIIYIGVGQEYKDLKEFDSDIVLKNLGLES